MTYRKYVSDEYPEIVEDPDPNSDLGVKVRVRHSKSIPESGELPVNILLGIPGNERAYKYIYSIHCSENYFLK
jgi:hypothetical protein